jgi:hypothetical protein
MNKMHYSPKTVLALYDQLYSTPKKQILFYRFIKKSTAQEFIHVIECLPGAKISLVPQSAQKYLSQEKLLYLKLQ